MGNNLIYQPNKNRNKWLLALISVLHFISFSWGQTTSNYRVRELTSHNIVIELDSLSIVPGSLILQKSNGQIVSNQLYHVNESNGTVELDSSLVGEPIKVSYRTLPLKLSSEVKGPLYGWVNNLDTNRTPIFKPLPLFGNQSSSWTEETLNKSGYIARGLSFGNQQDMIVNSALNLQLDGQLSDNIKVKAAITDQNVPIQPEGNTQQIQEFDKVFITLYNDKSSLTLGDFEIQQNQSYFLRSQKKVMGGQIMHQIDSKKKPDRQLKLEVSGAVSKGKFTRQNLAVKEGIQGPYTLLGANGETYIIVLAGTEKVFIDGILQSRGENNDYTIDYNTAQISFTTRRIITQESRVVVEFEYSDKNYARFTLSNQTQYTSKMADFRLNILSDHESKNQAINADYSDQEKQILSLAGDQALDAIVYNIDSLGFNASEIRYELCDSLGFDSVLVYSTDPNKALYRAGFAFVGQGKGDYSLTTSAANGRVYRWIMPQNGQHQGDYLPVKLLIAPKSQQMISFGGQLRLPSFSKIDYEMALSSFDANTFSSKDSHDDLSSAFRISFVQDLLTRDTSKTKIQIGVSTEQVQANFTAFERYRNVEFERNWNLTLIPNEKLSWYGAQVNFIHLNQWNLILKSQKLLQGQSFDAWQHGFEGHMNLERLSATFNVFNTQSEQNQKQSNFLKSNSILNYKILKNWQIGLKLWGEQQLNYDSIQKANNYQYIEWEAYQELKNEAQDGLILSYKQRQNKGAQNDGLSVSDMSQTVSASGQWNRFKNQQLSANVSFRNVRIQDSTLSAYSQNEQSLLGSIEHQINFWKSAISFRTTYQLSSGLELKKEFAYLEVAAGQGVYQWMDYNQNGIQELNEFEEAIFPDQKKYIRIYLPTQTYVKALSNEFSESINLYPYKMWRNKSGIRKWISKLSNTTHYKVSRKNQAADVWNMMNPFLINEPDSGLVYLNQSIRNTLSFNKISTIYGIDYVFLDYQQKNLLMNGYDYRGNRTQQGIAHVNLNEKIRIENTLENAIKNYHSEYFSNQDYKIEQWGNKIEFQWQIRNNLRWLLFYQYKTKNNLLGTEHAKVHQPGTELTYNVANRSNLQIKIEYFKFDYNAISGNSIAFEMLEGMLPGHNGQWSAQFQTQLSKYLQLNLSYLGRISQDNPVVHTAQAQLRAFF